MISTCILCQVCVFFFQAYQKFKMAALVSNWLRHFRLLILYNGICRNFTQAARSQRPLHFFLFSARSENQDDRPSLWFADAFLTSSLKTTEQNSGKHEMKPDLNVLYHVCVLWAYPKSKMSALASDWLRRFELLPCNRWTEFNEPWQEAILKRRSVPGTYNTPPS